MNVIQAKIKKEVNGIVSEGNDLMKRISTNAKGIPWDEFNALTANLDMRERKISELFYSVPEKDRGELESVVRDFRDNMKHLLNKTINLLAENGIYPEKKKGGQDESSTVEN